jgi:hypothetical protein
MAIVRAVEKVTHLIPESDVCLGEVVVQRACFAAPGRMLGLCMGLTSAPYVSTTEVYPDSPTVTDEVIIATRIHPYTDTLQIYRHYHHEHHTPSYHHQYYQYRHHHHHPCHHHHTVISLILLVCMSLSHVLCLHLQECTVAQVVAVSSGIDYILSLTAIA